MKVTFLYEGPHAVHAAWAKSVGAKFIPDLDVGPKIGSNWLKRIFSAFRRLFILNRVPKDTDVLLLEGGLGFVVGFLFKKFRKRKVLMIVSDPLFYLLKQRFFLAKICYFIMKDFDGFIPTSKMMTEFVPFKNKKVVYPFADIEKFKETKADINSNNLIYFGVLNKQKGVDKVVHVFLKLQKKMPKTKLFLVGDGPLKEGIKRINNKNIVLTGFVKNPENYIKKCSLYINLSRLDPFGVTVLEAMAAGLAPIISENVGAKDILKKIDKNLIAINEEKASKKIIELLTDKKKLTKLSKLSKKEAIKYNKKRSIEEFKKAFYGFLK